MDFTKFLALLETQQLHFTPIALFDDPFEGHPPRMVVEVQRAMPFGLSDEQYTKLSSEISGNLQSFRSYRNTVAASCWHLNQVESAAMWSLYLRSGEGIALRTTYANLTASLIDSPAKVYGAQVEYVDFEHFSLKDRNPFLWATYKRESFKHEQELRLLVEVDPTSAGCDLPIQLSRMHFSVYLAPTVPRWMGSLVERVLARYGLDCPVIQSSLGEAPSYYDA